MVVEMYYHSISKPQRAQSAQRIFPLLCVLWFFAVSSSYHRITSYLLFDCPHSFFSSRRSQGCGVILWLAMVLVFLVIASFYFGWKASRLMGNEVLAYELVFEYESNGWVWSSYLSAPQSFLTGFIVPEVTARYGFVMTSQRRDFNRT